MRAIGATTELALSLYSREVDDVVEHHTSVEELGRGLGLLLVASALSLGLTCQTADETTQLLALKELDRVVLGAVLLLHTALLGEREVGLEGGQATLGGDAEGSLELVLGSRSADCLRA